MHPPLNPPLDKEQRRMNDLVEIVVGEVAVLQLHRMKIRIPAVENSLLCTFDQRILS